MEKGIKMVAKIFIVLIIILCVYNPKIYAEDVGEEILKTADNFLLLGKENSAGATDKGQLKEMVDLVYNAFLGIGILASVIVGARLGINYMISAAEEQAKIKETLEPYIIGCIVTFGAFGIWKIVILLLRQV